MTLSLTLKGFDYSSYYNGGFEDANSLGSLVATGANAVALTTDYGINAETSTVYADPVQTDSLTALSDTILQAESLGLSVMVRPLVDLVNQSYDGTLTGDWRESYNPTDPDAFFASYKTMIVNEAKIAQQDGAQLLCIGTELDQLTGPQYLSQWTDIINAVRAVYSGKLTYSANWDAAISPWTYGGAPAGTGDFTTQISFWKQLDYVGIDEYAAISDAANPTLTQLEQGWTQTPTDAVVNQTTGGNSLIGYYESISASLDMPLLFTEIGYQNATDAASNEGGTSKTNVVDDALQANLYQAFFDAWQQSGNNSLEGTYFWNWDPNTAEVGPNNGVNWSPQELPAETVVSQEYAACFMAGTRLATEAGETRVEDLRIGDLVRTGSGAHRPIRWIGHRSYDGRFVVGNVDVLPIIFCAGALADGVPRRDLFVSPGHAMLLDGILVPAGMLVNGRTIRQIETVTSLQYFHIELESHDILLAEDAPVESYLDNGNRGCFINAASWTEAHPDHRPSERWETCAPLVCEGPELVAIKQRLFARAGAPQSRRLDLLVRAEGGTLARVLRPEPLSRSSWWFAVPTGSKRLRLTSTGFIPAHCVADSLDRRRLGVSLCRIEMNGKAVALDSPLLAEGFYNCEGLAAERPWRWTNGDAFIKLPENAFTVILETPDAFHSPGPNCGMGVAA